MLHTDFPDVVQSSDYCYSSQTVITSEVGKRQRSSEVAFSVAKMIIPPPFLYIKWLNGHSLMVLMTWQLHLELLAFTPTCRYLFYPQSVLKAGLDVGVNNAV